MRLSTGDCFCKQCDICKTHYIDIVTHNCSGSVLNCLECNSIITSTSGMCYFCELENIKSVCDSITPFKQINSPQCLRCLCDIVDNKSCP